MGSHVAVIFRDPPVLFCALGSSFDSASAGHPAALLRNLSPFPRRRQRRSRMNVSRFHGCL